LIQTILDNKVPEFNRSLVFRVKEIEFGTNLSTDGLVKLNNFVTFHEAVIEFLKMDDVDVLLQNDLDRATADISSGQSTTAVLTGPIGGFSGTLNLSIPWSNGCLNLQKIDADVSVDSLELLLQISSIRWFMHVLDSLHRNQCEHNCAHNTADNMSLNTSRSALSASKSVMASREDSDQTALSQSRQDKYQDSFLTKAHVIQDWIPELVVHEDQGDPDSDCDERFVSLFHPLKFLMTFVVPMCLSSSSLPQLT
jgi:autophagy-related protein 2